MSSGQTNPNEWGEFLHLPGEKFHDFSKIRDEIVKDTEKHTGKNAGQSDPKSSSLPGSRPVRLEPSQPACTGHEQTRALN